MCGLSAVCNIATSVYVIPACAVYYPAFITPIRLPVIRRRGSCERGEGMCVTSVK